MNILLFGDSHTYGCGLPARQLSYTGHFIQMLSRAGRSVQVEAYAHLTLPESTAMMTGLSLSQYDLIVLQLGPDLLHRKRPGTQPAQSVASRVLPVLGPPNPSGSRTACSRFKKYAGDVGKGLMNMAEFAVPAFTCPKGLADLLTLLRPYRHNVLLMTPFPCRSLPEQWLRDRSRSVLLDEGMDQAFSVFDTSAVVQPRDEYFLTGHDELLNGISHELIGKALFDFYQSAPTIVTVQTINRN